MHDVVTTLSRRVDRLERERRGWRVGAGAMAVGVAAVVLMGQAAPAAVEEVIQAKRFVLRDASGTIRAELKAEPWTSLLLSNAEGRVRAQLWVTDLGDPRLYLYDGAGTRRVTLGLVGGAPVVDLADDAGKIRAGVAVASDGAPVIDLRTREGAVIWKAP